MKFLTFWLCVSILLRSYSGTGNEKALDVFSHLTWKLPSTLHHPPTLTSLTHAHFFFSVYHQKEISTEEIKKPPLQVKRICLNLKRKTGKHQQNELSHEGSFHIQDFLKGLVYFQSAFESGLILLWHKRTKWDLCCCRWGWHLAFKIPLCYESDHFWPFLVLNSLKTHLYVSEDETVNVQ